jgi:integrase
MKEMGSNIERTKASKSREGFIPNPKLKLLDQVSEVMRFKHYSFRTETTYREWIRRFILFHGKRHPREMGVVEVERFLSDLAVTRKVAASTQNQAFNALLFLYRDVLHLELGELGRVERAKRPERLPVVLTRAEVDRLLAGMSGTFQLMAKLLYGTGLRLMECVRLRVKDVDFEQNQVTVREGKGFKDRVTMLPGSVKGPLAEHLKRVKLLHAQDLAAGQARAVSTRTGIPPSSACAGLGAISQADRYDVDTATLNVSPGQRGRLPPAEKSWPDFAAPHFEHERGAASSQRVRPDGSAPAVKAQ